MKIGIRKNVYNLVKIQLIDILLINIIINFKINYQIKILTSLSRKNSQEYQVYLDIRMG